MAHSTNRGGGAMGELDPLIGRTISGRYRVHALIGQGGMGKVFEAQQIPLGRSVALKVLSTTQTTASDAEFQQRFLHEAAILAKLKSPHTVTIFDYGRDGNTFFIAMELVSGKPLDRVLREAGVLSPAHAVSAAMQIARSLREAHTLGVVHRDLKPANVLVARTADGEEHIKVLDFGLAKRLSVTVEDTNRDLVPGSPKYMAPEVIRQEPVDGRADIYALGILLYQMLVGRVPFDAENPLDILLAHVQQAPTPMAQMNPNVRVPAALEQLVMRCLSKQPAARFASMHEVITALRTLAGQLGLSDEAQGALSMMPPAFTTSAGSESPARLTPGAPSGSGRPAGGPAPRRSDAPRLRLDFDATPSGTQMRAGAARAKALLLPLSIAAACSVVGALLVWLFVSPSGASEPRVSARSLPFEAQAQAEPSEPSAQDTTAQAATAQALDPEPPMMDLTDQVFDDEPAAPRKLRTETPLEAPAVTVTARSEPEGAAVYVRGTKMGLTPVTFRYQDPSAKPGEVLNVSFQLEGYVTRTVREPISSNSLFVRTVLRPAADEPDQAPADPAEESANEDALLELQERARQLSKPVPDDSVLKVTETPAAP